MDLAKKLKEEHENEIKRRNEFDITFDDKIRELEVCIFTTDETLGFFDYFQEIPGIYVVDTAYDFDQRLHRFTIISNSKELVKKAIIENPYLQFCNSSEIDFLLKHYNLI